MAPWLYRLLMLLLPRGFREEFGEEMAGVVQERWTQVRRRRGAWTRLAFWARESRAVVRCALAVRRREREQTERMTMGGLVQDLGYGARALARRPGFALATIITLGLGIGATTAVFSAVRTVLLRPLPYDNGERVASLFQVDLLSGERTEGVSAGNIRDLNESARLMDAVAVAEPWSLDLHLEGRTETLRTWAVSVGFFDVLGTEAELGRTFTADEYVEGQDRVVLFSHRSWLARLGGDPAVVGTTITLDGEAYRIVGILPLGFRFPDAADAWIPRPPRPWDEQGRSANFMTGIGLLARGANIETAQSEMDRLAASLAEAHPDTNGDVGIHLMPLSEYIVGNVRSPLWILMSAVGVVLLIACANVAGLMLARGAQRGREYALRGALGAGTGRLVQQIGVESLILAAGGSALGIALTYAGLAAIRSMGSRTLPRIDELAVDGVVLAFAVAVGVASALLAGLLPTWRLARPDLREAMGDGGRGSIGARGGTSLRRRLVVVEVAAAVVLLIGAGLLVKSFAVLVDQELGFDPGDRLAVQVFAYDYASPAAQAEFLDEAVRQMRAIPGVREVALTSNLPGSTDGDVASIEIEVPFTVVDRASPPEGQEPTAVISAVSDGYFDVLEIPLVSGRGFQRTDDGEAPAVLVISETLARRHFGDADPLGEKLAVSYGRLPPAEIVGVARDVRPTGHASAPRPEIYLPIAQAPTGSITFVLEAERDAASLTEAAFQAIWTANPSQAIWGSATLESLLRDWLEVRRFNLILLSTFAGVALLLAAVGIYGLISYSVEQRLGELGIRRALGGNTATLLGMVVLEGAWLGGAGIAIGVVGALLLTRFLQGMLFGVEPTDPATFALLALAVLGVSTCAALVPALRAVRVDPVDALRAD